MNYYVIPTKVDTLSTNIIKIHIAEGPFDILSIFTNLCNCNMESNIYIHRNTMKGQKDYGVPLNQICDSVRVIKYYY